MTVRPLVTFDTPVAHGYPNVTDVLTFTLHPTPPHYQFMTDATLPAFVEVYRPANHAELVAVRHVLDGMPVRYFVRNEYAARGTPSIGCDELIVMVETARAAEARSRVQAALE